jgi:hypothetical protein
MGVRSYRDLIAWQKAMDLAVAVFRLTDGLPRREVYALGAQLRRAAMSVPSNIAEGQGRGATKEYVRFLRIARGVGTRSGNTTHPGTSPRLHPGGLLDPTPR